MKEKTSKQKVDFSILKMLGNFLSPYKVRVFIFALALIFTSAMTLSVGHGIRLLIDNGFIQQSTTHLFQAISFIVLISIGMAAGTFIRFYLISWIGERIITDIRKAVFNHIVTLHPSFFENNRSGEIMSRLTTDTTVLQTIIGSSFSIFLRSTIMFFGGLTMLAITNIKLTLIILLGVPLTLLPIIFFGKRVRKLSRKSQDSIAEVGTFAGEIIQQIKTVQSYTQESNEKKAFGKEAETAFDIARKRILQRGLLMAGVILLIFTAISAMLWVGGNDVISGKMSGGDLGAFIFYALLVAASVGSLSEVIGNLQRATGATERLMELLNEKSLITSGPKTSEHIQSLAAGFILDNISFSYPTRPDTTAIKELSLTVHPGKVLALVGPSGAGKTTIFELMQRFYDPKLGTIYLGDNKEKVKLDHLNLQALRQQLAVVSQQPSLFTANVLDNIRYGRPDANDDEVKSAAIAAHADEFISQLPEGYHSNLGEQGVRLSGGQRQRIAIARAILKNPKILLLDEATSALDNESEWHVQQALKELMKNRTTIIIAHRLSTIEHADEIAVIENGELVGLGKHKILLEKNSLYQKLATRNFS